MRNESEYVNIGKDILGYKTDSDYVAHGQDFLAHFGTKGQKWGRRRYQNEDGSLTPEGYIHYGYALPDHEYSGPYEGRAEGRGTNAGGSGPNGGRTHYSKKDYKDAKYREVDDDAIDVDYQEYDDADDRYDDTPDLGMQEAIDNASGDNKKKKKGDGEKWQNEDLYKQYKDLKEANQYHDELEKYKQNYPGPPKPMSDREKALTALNATSQTASYLSGKDSPLNALAKMDKEKKQSNARAMNAAGINNLSNQQLQAIIDRKRLENTYLNETTPQVQSGYEKTMQILGVVGALAGTATAVIGVANAVKQMKG